MKQKPDWMTSEDFSLVNSVEMALKQHIHSIGLDREFYNKALVEKDHNSLLLLCLEYAKLAEKEMKKYKEWGWSTFNLPKRVRRLLREE